MKTTNIKTKKILSLISLSLITINTLMPITATKANNDNIIYPLKEISKLECRFTNFDELSSDCKQQLPVLKTGDYKKYAKKDGWYNDYTRLYTVLWWSSYKYGWDVWNWGHMWTDIATAKWTPVYSIANWTVIKSWNDWMLWKSVVIKHVINWKTIVSSYSHMSKINVSVWDKVYSWTKVWEVGSTWNSTWNHLHFQIDIDTKNSPAYYDYNSCPYSYYSITEEWKCYNELKRLTVDPLLFLETKWAVLNNIKTTTQKVDRNEIGEDWIDISIFNRTVHVGYAINDVKQVQKIMTKFGYYNNNLSGDYNDVIDAVIDYQVERGVIENRNSTWAGWFGPSTRAQAKKDYNNNFITSWEVLDDEYSQITENTIETQKIERNNLMTRKEIEALEVKNFLKDYNIELNFKKAWTNVAVWDTEILELEITDRLWRPFKGNMPWTMTFIANQEKINLFPTKLFYFTDGKRDIQITWLKEWNTKLYIKVWDVNIKTFNINIYNWKKTIYPESATLINNKNIVLWDSSTWIWVFQDSEGKKMINLPFGSTFKLKWTPWTEVCIKRGNLNTIRSTYARWCSEDEYKQEIDFTYDDTIVWLLIFDYRTTNRDAKIEIVNNYNNVTMSSSKLTVNNPKGLAYNYEYKNEVLSMLEDWIVSWINQWYFMQDRQLNQVDAYNWISNSLENLKNQTNDNKTKNEISNKINELNRLKRNATKYKYLTRMDFTALTYKYLINNQKVEVEKNYKDLDESKNMVASAVLKWTTWKDTYWESYFQPSNTITRWEASFILSTTLNNFSNKQLTLK